MSRIRWHYPRTDLAARIYAVLAGGPVQAVSLFGPRRTGKTQFLTHDMAPLAEAKGHRVVYASLWQTIDRPLAILLYEFDRALRGGSILERIATAARDIVPKLTLDLPGGAGKLEVDLSDLRGKAPEAHVLLLDQYCERLSDVARPTFLLIDEFQELARTPGSSSLVAALRTSLDKRRDGIVAVFTGSSRHGLRAMFTARDAPFLRFASPFDLPALNDDFVDHQLAAFRATSKAMVDRAIAIETFQRFGRSPLFFQRWLTTIAFHPELGAQAAALQVQTEVSAEFGFARQWVSLAPVQRATARALAEKAQRIYGRDEARRIAELTGCAAVETSQVQTALKRLERLGLADRFGASWSLTDPIFEAWVLARPDADF